MTDWPFADVRRLLFVGAHPDDLETIVGGTLYQMIQRGVEVVEVVCTDGNIGTHDTERFTRKSLAKTRRKETRAAAQFLGIQDVVFLGYDDGELVPSLELRAALAEQYRIFQPDTLMTFDPNVEGHPDHRACGRAATDALIPASMPFYQKKQLRKGIKPSAIRRTYVFGGRPHERQPISVDVSELWDMRLAAMKLHACQFGGPDMKFDWLERWMSKQGEAIGVKYAEQVWPL